MKHWERVRENAEYLARQSGGDSLLCQLFAYLHDCCRESDGADPEHGARAAAFAKTLLGKLLPLDDDRFELLAFACEHHEKGRTTDDATVGACWDADRLDLGRVGIHPNRKYLSTAAAKRKSVIDWGYRRSRGQDVRLKG